MTIRGADVASWQGEVDWTAFAAGGMAFTGIKLTEGVDYVDPNFAGDWAGAQAANVVRIAYHFARPDANAPEAEAAYFLEQLAAAGGIVVGDSVALDIEAGDGNLLGWVQTWLTTVEAALGMQPLLYSGVWFMEPHGLLDASLTGHGLWLAAYQSTMPPPPAPWDVLAIWQSGSAGSVPGIPGPADTDIFNGTREQLLRYGATQPWPLAKPVWDNNDLVQMGRLLYRLDRTGNPDPDWAGARDYAGSKT